MGFYENNDKAVIAKALGRQDFWKAAYLAATRYVVDSESAAAEADRALVSFDQKFGNDLCPPSSSK